jgi:hypothetical protein
VELAKRDSKKADDADKDQIHCEEEHSEVLFHSVKSGTKLPAWQTPLRRRHAG